MIVLSSDSLPIEEKLARGQQAMKASMPLFQQLVKRLSKFTGEYEPNNADDARHSGWQGLVLVVMVGLGNLKSFFPVHANPELLQEYCFFSIPTDKSKKQMVDTFEVMQRAAFLSIFMFQVEVFLKNIAKAINIDLKTSGKKPKSKGFRAITREIIFKLFSENQEERIHFLNMPAMIRNCLHSSGYHNEAGFKILIDGKVYEFVRSEKIEFASWVHIYIFLNKLVDVLEEIVNSKSVKKIKKIEKYSFIEKKKKAS